MFRQSFEVLNLLFTLHSHASTISCKIRDLVQFSVSSKFEEIYSAFMLHDVQLNTCYNATEKENNVNPDKQQNFSSFTIQRKRRPK